MADRNDEPGATRARDDEDPTDTPGTDQDQIDEDARLTEQEPDSAAIDEPTRDGEQEAGETVWMMKELTTVGLASILMLVLLVVALMQATGVVDLYPFADSAAGEWGVFGALVVAAIAILAWTRRGT